MSLTLSVTSSSTLFVTNIPTNITSLVFESSVDGVQYTSLPGSPVSINVGTTAYSLTISLIPSAYYRVSAAGGTPSVAQYILRTQGATGSSTSSFTNVGTGSATIGSTSVTLNANGNAVTSDQIYSPSQAIYYQLTTPVQASMGNGNYTMSLYSGAFDSGQAGGSLVSAYFRVTTSAGPTTTVQLFRCDNGAETEIVMSPAITVTQPTSLALYWDGTNTVYYYVGNVLRTTYRYTNTWASIRSAVQVATLTTPFTLSDVRLYVTGGIPTSTNWRLDLRNVTGTSLTSATSPAITNSTYGAYYYITNSGFANLTLPNITSTTDTGAFYVLRNNTSSYLSVSLTGASGLPAASLPSSPLVIPPSNSVTLVWTGSAYVLF